MILTKVPLMIRCDLPVSAPISTPVEHPGADTGVCGAPVCAISVYFEQLLRGRHCCGNSCDKEGMNSYVLPHHTQLLLYSIISERSPHLFRHPYKRLGAFPACLLFPIPDSYATDCYLGPFLLL